MNFTPQPEQQQLGEMVQRFLAEHYSFEARRKILDSPAGFSREVWSKLAEQGLLGLQLPEDLGGLAPAPVETLLTATALGKAMLLEPFLSSALIGTAMIREVASAKQREALLVPMSLGERIAVPAHVESSPRWEPRQIETTARNGLLNGRKKLVLHAPVADLLLVSARTANGISLFAVAREKAQLDSYRTFDGSPAADVTLHDAPGELLGEEGKALAGIEKAFDLGLAAVCSEAAGALQAALDATIDYAKTRKQFGVPIAKFQALSHRMADMLIHVEQARSMSYLAALRQGDRRALSAAKVVIGNACRFVGQQAVQIHGGMGVTDEMPVSHLFKRLTALEMMLGDTAQHLEQLSRETT